MKKSILIIISIFSFQMFSQEHFSGIATSSRVGILNAGINPSELANMSNRFETNVIGFSFNIANNKIGFKDISSGKNLEELIFKGNDPVNLRFNAEVYGPSFAMKYNKWAFGITTKANAKLDIIDVDTKIGDAISNAGINSILGTTTINNNYNQRISGTTWGEVGLTVAKNLYDEKSHKLSIGATFKLLFPGSYANLGADKFQGTINNTAGQSYLNNTVANLNIAYSGSLANSFTNFGDYSKSIFGGFNGFSGDIGVNYQWKDEKSITPKSKNKYKLNTGLSIRNLGSMTFKDANNSSTNYDLKIQSTLANPLGLNLNQFDNVDSLQGVETTLQNSGYLTKTTSNKDFKVKLPAVFSAYADVKLVSKLFVSGFIQQKINPDNNNDQVTSQNLVTITPRFSTGYFEVFSPWTKSEISGTNGGVGFRVGGFYIGSGSVITALINDSKQADFYTGFRWSFL
jgi:hypothetical protein